MNPSKIPAPGPYEVAIIIDEEGKARGSKGEKWILIKNADGAIATVYPASNAEATANLLAASASLLEQLRIAVSVLLALEPKADVSMMVDAIHSADPTWKPVSQEAKEETEQ
jgi:hypothetical protein